MITGQETAGQRHDHASATTVQARLRRPVAATRSTPTRPCGEEISGGRDMHRARQASRCRRRAYRRRLQLQGRRPAEEGRQALGRRAQPRAPRQDAEERAATCCCSTSRPTTSTSKPCARWKTALRRLRRLRRGHQPRPLVPRPHRDPHPGLRGRQRTSNGSKATSRTTRKTRSAAWARRSGTRSGRRSRSLER